MNEGAQVRIIADHLARNDIKVFAVDPGKIDIVAPGLTLRTKLIDGTYPDYQRVLPNAEAQAFTFDLKRDEIVAAIEQATAIGGERTRAIKFSNVGGRAVVERGSPEFGNARIRTSTAWATEKDRSPATPLGCPAPH